jgi:hypothetical protein
MNLRAIAITSPPLIVWQETTAEVGGVVIAPEDKPAEVFGVCPLKIVAGELVERTEGEMSGYEIAYNLQALSNTQEARLSAMEKKGFVYDTRTFPLTYPARTYYNAIAKSGTDVSVYDTAGEVYTLAAANIEDFLEAMNTKIAVELQPTT